MAKKFYVTMTDKFFSGWGKASNMISKLVIECETIEEAEIVERNARKRSEMINVNILSYRPRYDRRTHQTSYHSKADYPNFFRPGAFG